MNKGFLLAFLAAACWGGVYIAYHFTLEKISPLRIMIYGGILDLVILVPFLIWKGEKLFDESLKEPGVLMVLTIAMLVGLTANFLILYSIKLLGANTAAILEISYPVFTCLGLYLFFGKQLDTQFIVGAFLIFVGTCLIVTRTEVTSDSPAVHSQTLQLEIQVATSSSTQVPTIDMPLSESYSL